MWRWPASELKVLLWLRTLQHVARKFPFLLSQTMCVRIIRGRWGSVEGEVVRVTTISTMWLCIIFTFFTLIAVIFIILLLFVLFRTAATMTVHKAACIQWFPRLALLARWWKWGLQVRPTC